MEIRKILILFLYLSIYNLNKRKFNKITGRPFLLNMFDLKSMCTYLKVTLNQ